MEKSVEVHRQIRENTEELQDYLKDLVNWEKEMKRKDEEIKKRSHEDPVLPPIRSAHCSSKKKKTKEKQSDSSKEKSENCYESQKSQKSGRIPGYDYNAWDKFNVDEALKEVDENEIDQDKKSSSEEEDDSESEMYELERKKQLAVIEKDKGNEFFKKGNYDKAISCYTMGIQHDTSNALLPANRAMAFLKKGQLAAAETDCSTCLAMDPTYVKAYLRRGAARLGLKKYQDARLDFCKVLDFEPDNNQAKLELERLQKELFLSKDKINADSVENEKASNEPMDIPENNKEKTIKILENISTSIAENNLSNTFEPSANACANKIQMLLKSDDSDSCIIKPIQKPLHLRSQEPMKRILVKDESGITEFVESSLGCKNSPSSAISLQEKNIPVEESGVNDSISILCDTSDQFENGEEISSSSMKFMQQKKSLEKKKVKVEALTSVSSIPSLPPVPLTSYQFLADWKKLISFPELLHKYIKQFPPERFSSVFKQSIDTELFCGILHILSSRFVENSEDVFLYLKHLRNVGRFKTLVMFLAGEEIAALNQLFQYVRSSQKYSAEEIQIVEKDYGLS